LNELVGSEQHVCYHPNGAPYLANNTLNISISHTGHYALVAIHPTDKVGIDIERIGDKVGRVRHKFLSREELGAVDARSEKIHLTILWAAKEAMYKVMGVETVEFTEQIRIEPFTPYMEGEIVAHETASAEKKTYKLQYKVYPEFVIVHTI
jgi:phosphopantetheinyl transferase